MCLLLPWRKKEGRRWEEGYSGEVKTILVGFRNVWDIMPAAETSGPTYFFFSINSCRFPKKQTTNSKTSCDFCVCVMKSHERVSEILGLDTFSYTCFHFQGLEKLYTDVVLGVNIFI